MKSLATWKPPGPITWNFGHPTRTLELARWLEINITVAVGILERLDRDMGEVGDGGFC